MRLAYFPFLGLAVLVLSTNCLAVSTEVTIDLSNAVIYEGPGIRPAVGSGQYLRAEIEHRTGLKWKVISELSEAQGHPIVAVGKQTKDLDWAGHLKGRLADGKGPNGAEGYRIEIDAENLAVVVVGNDDRGVIFGIGRLLRELRLEVGSAHLPKSFQVSTAPKTKLRGHQLGYRAKTNSYDAWDRDQWYRYIRDLSLFGTNAIELVPPRTDDDLDSPHFPLPPMEMMIEMSNICDSFDMDVWIWFPVMDAVDTDPSKIEPLLKEWDEIFKKLKRVNAIFVPGGDPGAVPPKPLFDFLAKATGILHRSHPKAQMWVSPQGFNRQGMEEFLELTRAEPPWLNGIVYGPQVRVFLPELRKLIPAKYPIRGYPDITHNRQCQHPVPDWDLAYAWTEGREAINPRPFAQAELAKAYFKDTIGFISYSEGCNDDVNKIVWSTQAWDPEGDVNVVLEQYSRVFIGAKSADSFAKSLFALERNWSGPLLTNSGVETTLKQLQGLERTASTELRRNWRFQQALYRAYYDAYIRDRLLQETALEARAMEILRHSTRLGTELAMNRATEILEKSLTEPVSTDRRARIFELGEALYQSVRMQLSKPKYLAIAAERGANLDTIDTPVNNRVWLGLEFNRIRTLGNETEKLIAIDALLDRENPGPGGFYDQLGDPSHSPHLIHEPSTTEDPLFSRATFQGFAIRTDWPVAWRRYASTFYDAPLMMHYEGLDRHASYKIRVVYSGDSPKAKMRLEADRVVIHDLLTKPEPVRPLEFSIPVKATEDGKLDLKWNGEPGRGGNGRGCQVAEVWLIRE